MSVGRKHDNASFRQTPPVRTERGTGWGGKRTSKSLPPKRGGTADLRGDYGGGGIPPFTRDPGLRGRTYPQTQPKVPGSRDVNGQGKVKTGWGPSVGNSGRKAPIDVKARPSHPKSKLRGRN